MNNKKRYNSLDNYFKSVFWRKIYKVSLDGGFTCPNRDGTFKRQRRGAYSAVKVAVEILLDAESYLYSWTDRGTAKANRK